MSDFQYKSTVIVPVYNVEKYISACIDSIIKQTENFKNIQLLLINDGSTDSSEEICKKYTEKYENITLFSKSNEGLSKTRNLGLTRAEGKYIFFLDSDDTLERNTIKSVTDFFDTVYDDVDLVTYRITQYYDGRPAVVHFRYQTLTSTGVYDLTLPKNRFITQTNINICVKNKLEENILFDVSPDFRHEDEKFCCDILSEKMKIGYCSKGEYIYNRNNVDSIVSTQFSPEKIFESSMKFYEELFEKYKPNVPPYFQGIVFNDFRWKLKDDKFLPTHYSGEEWSRAEKRINNLLALIDEDTIVLHPSANEYHTQYWLSRKPNSFPTVLSNEDNVFILSNGRKIYSTSKFKAFLSEVIQNDDLINLSLYIKSPVFTHIDQSRYNVVAEFDDTSKMLEKSENSVFGADECKTITNFFPMFTLKADTDSVLECFIVIDGYRFPLSFSFDKSVLSVEYDGTVKTEDFCVSVGKKIVVKKNINQENEETNENEEIIG